MIKKIEISLISQLKSLFDYSLNIKLDNPTMNIPKIAKRIPINYCNDNFFWSMNFENAAVTIIS